MKLEMEKSEPLYFIFGIPICTTVIVVAAFVAARHTVPDNNVTVLPAEGAAPVVNVTPKVEAALPKGGISITTPPATVIERTTEVVKNIRVEQPPLPSNVTLSYDEAAEAKKEKLLTDKSDVVQKPTDAGPMPVELNKRGIDDNGLLLPGRSAASKMPYDEK